MTLHDNIRRDIASQSRTISNWRTVALSCLVALFVARLSAGELMQQVISIVTFVGFIGWGLAVYGITKRIQCPGCKKSLGYLLMDPSYSKTYAPLWMPKDIPVNITSCPYCHIDFEKDEEAPPSGNSADRAVP